MAADTTVPTSFDELVARYDRLIVWMVRRTVKGRLDEADLDDIKQVVYLRIVRYDYLTRVQRHVAVHGGAFSSSLCRLVQNEASRWARRQARVTRGMESFDQRTRRSEAPVSRPVIASHASSVEACNFLDVLEQRLREARVGTSCALGDVLRAARHYETLVGAQLQPALQRPDGAAPDVTSIRRYVRTIRRVAHALRDEEVQRGAAATV